MNKRAFKDKNIKALFDVIDKMIGAQSIPPVLLVALFIIEHLELFSFVICNTVILPSVTDV